MNRTIRVEGNGLNHVARCVFVHDLGRRRSHGAREVGAGDGRSKMGPIGDETSKGEGFIGYQEREENGRREKEMIKKEKKFVFLVQVLLTRIYTPRNFSKTRFHFYVK